MFGAWGKDTQKWFKELLAAIDPDADMLRYTMDDAADPEAEALTRAQRAFASHWVPRLAVALQVGNARTLVAARATLDRARLGRSAPPPTGALGNDWALGGY